MFREPCALPGPLLMAIATAIILAIHGTREGLYPAYMMVSKLSITRVTFWLW